jgi:hypothetical protein
MSPPSSEPSVNQARNQHEADRNPTVLNRQTLNTINTAEMYFREICRSRLLEVRCRNDKNISQQVLIFQGREQTLLPEFSMKVKSRSLRPGL